jgi:replication factor A1
LRLKIICFYTISKGLFIYQKAPLLHPKKRDVMEENMESAPAERVKLKDLTPQSKNVNVLVKVTGIGAPKEIPNKFGGEPKRVAEARVGDETGTIVLSLWQDQIGSVQEGDVLYIENGYISLVQGHMRLNVGKYGKMAKSDEAVPEVNTEVDFSSAGYEQERRRFRPRYGGFRGRGRR